MKSIIISLLFISFSALADITIKQAWVKNAPPVVPVRAAYLTFVNNSKNAETISKITSPQFKSVEAHETTLNNGVYSMKPLNKVQIKGLSTLVLTPKGKHLMLMMPTQPLNSYTNIQLDFHFVSGKTIRINAPIKNSL